MLKKRLVLLLLDWGKNGLVFIKQLHMMDQLMIIHIHGPSCSVYRFVVLINHTYKYTTNTRINIYIYIYIYTLFL